MAYSGGGDLCFVSVAFVTLAILVDGCNMREEALELP